MADAAEVPAGLRAGSPGEGAPGGGTRGHGTAGGLAAHAAAMLAVAAASLYLLVYVGYGEAARTFPRFLQQKTEAQGELLRSAMSSYVQAGMPLRQYPGFAT